MVRELKIYRYRKGIGLKKDMKTAKEYTIPQNEHYREMNKVNEKYMKT